MLPSDIPFASKRATAVSFIDTAVAFSSAHIIEYETDDDGFLVLNFKTKKKHSCGHELLLSQNIPYSEGIRFGEVWGKLRVGKEVTNLLGFPTKIHGSLILSYMELDNMIGCPREISGAVWIIGTKINHFKGFCLPLSILQGSASTITSVPGYKAYKLIEKVSRV
jgi:hypothetical protein